MLQNITFLLGAGASSKSLPIANGLPESMQCLATKLENYEIDIFQEEKTQFIKDLKWLAEEALKHETIDMFAYDKLYKHIVDKTQIVTYGKVQQKIDRKNDYERLKKTLSAFFQIIQYKNVDHRYRKLIGYIVKKERNSVYTIPSNIKVITWNYDYQLELCYSEHYKNSDPNDVSAMIASFPCPFLMGDHPFHYNKKNFDPTSYKTSIIHLNGLAGLFKKDNKLNIIDIINAKDEKTMIENVLKNYNDSDNFIHFAWDKENNELSKKIALKETIGTEILVIIGYSFPIFNKLIDNEIINNMKSLKTIYIQDRDEKIDEIKELLNKRVIIKDVELKGFCNLETFCIPDEIKT